MIPAIIKISVGSSAVVSSPTLAKGSANRSVVAVASEVRVEADRALVDIIVVLFVLFADPLGCTCTRRFVSQLKGDT